MEAYKKAFEERHKLNSLVSCTLTSVGDNKIRDLTINNSFINPESTNGLHMMSGTYLYTNPPPYGYGTPAPYVAATILRAYSYNHKPNKEEEEFHNLKFLNTQIYDLNEFPKIGVTGNYFPPIVTEYTNRFLIKNFKYIQQSAERTIENLKTMNADNLSKGRQTWDPETLKSTTCAKAYYNMMLIIKNNLGKTPGTMIENFLMWYELYDRPFLKVRERQIKTVEKYQYNKRLQTRIRIGKRKYVIKNITIRGIDNVNKWLDDYMRSFCSYIKHAERNRKDRRAIASGSPPLRLHLKTVEDFSLELSKHIDGSTISIGGEEKKKKIISELQNTDLDVPLASKMSLQATEDATKWNECQNPGLFALVFFLFFSRSNREKLNLPMPTENEEAFLYICLTCFYYMLVKRINLGQGFLFENDKFYNRLEWNDLDYRLLNDYNQPWFRSIGSLLEPNGYIRASPGFLMGMFNAASTIIGLIASGGLQLQHTKICSLRSSDDSMTVFTAGSIDALVNLIYLMYNIYRLFGINPSKEKNFLFPEGYGEYTSSYQDGQFVGQYGVETSSLKPGGHNPQDDFNATISNTLQLIRTNTINILGCISRIMLGIQNVRMAWNIKPNLKDKLVEQGTPLKVIFLSEGGINPWTPENLICDEATLRYLESKKENNFDHFHIIMDPGNPFSEPPEETLLYNKDIGTFIAAEENNPRNVFCYIRKSNRTNRSQESAKDVEKERLCQEAFKITTSIDPSFILHVPTSRDNLAEHLSSTLLLVQGKLADVLSNDEFNLITEARLRLQMGVESEDIEEEASQYDSL
uniref:RNA-directed RNA polymerase catalytic subunit n=1 Tax=Soybean thrips quaranja-like virus 3 TaxID=2796552 RepID=A0A7T3R0N8_9ORTO|nr:putative polymerase PB1 [Soybean thrips quaranja-like virus 3]